MPLDDDYLEWLYAQVGSVDNKNLSKSYWTLMKFLYTKEFTWSYIEKDGNRAQDGRDLRRQFLADTGLSTRGDPGFLDYGCSFLELMIGICVKLEFQSDMSVREWFWVLIENLGLKRCTDANPPDQEIINHILDKVLNRQYAPNGAGGLFPLQQPEQDQRDVELYYQGEAYLLERL